MEETLHKAMTVSKHGVCAQGGSCKVTGSLSGNEQPQSANFCCVSVRSRRLSSLLRWNRNKPVLSLSLIAECEKLHLTCTVSWSCKGM